MNKLLLRLIMLPSFLWKALGADLVQLEAILTMRITIDDRKPVGIGRRQNQKKDIKHGSITSAFLFTLMGGVYSFPIWFIEDRVFGMSVYFSLLFLIITLTLITDFSNTLFDNRDKYILFPRPVGDRTIVLSKLLHVFIYLLRMVLPMSLVGWIAMGYLDGWKSAVLFPLPLTLMVCMALFLVNSFYLVVLQVTKADKFKDVINYFQILTSVIFFASVYLLPQLFKDENAGTMLSFTRFKWMQYLPSSWLGSCWTWIGFHQSVGNGTLNSLLGVLTPILSAFILIKYLAPQFTKKISGIDGAEVTESKQVIAGKAQSKTKLYVTLANLFNTSDEARAGFMITWLQSSRSRTFRMRVYPSFAFVPIYFLYLMLQGKDGSLSYQFEHLKETSKYFLLLYMSSYVLIMSMNYLIVSDQFKASWVYYAAPLAVPGKVMIGALKALWVKFFLPFFLVLAGFAIWVWGGGIVPDILIALVNVTLMAVCMARLSYRQLPFSMMEQQKQKGGRIFKSILTMLLPFTLGFGHYAARHFWWLELVLLFLSFAMLWLLWDSYTNTSWEHIGQEEANS